MSARSIGSAKICIDLVTIPVKLFTAHSKKEVSFNRLERGTGARVKQQIVSTTTTRILEHADLISGYEYTPGQFVTFSPEELKNLELRARAEDIVVIDTVPLVSIEMLHITKSLWLGPNKGAEHVYSLLVHAFNAKQMVAIAQQGSRTRDDLLILRSCEGHLVLHECLYGDEVRSAVDIPAGVDRSALSPREIELAVKLIDRRARATFDASRYRDLGAERVKAAVDRKVAGAEIVTPPAAEGPAVLPLIDALEQSVRASRSRPRRERRAS